VHTVPTVFEAVSRPLGPEVRSDDGEFGVRSPWLRSTDLDAAQWAAFDSFFARVLK